MNALMEIINVTEMLNVKILTEVTAALAMMVSQEMADHAAM